MLESWFSDPSKVGATALLVTAVVALVTGYFVVPRWMFDKVVADCNDLKERNTRLSDQLDRQIAVAEVTATTVAKAVRKP